MVNAAPGRAAVKLRPADARAAARAAHLLRRGGVIIYPTETVYGLGALPEQAGAVERIAALKGSGEEARFLLLIRDLDDLERWASPVCEAAGILARAFWPGPLTLILPARPDLHPRLVGPGGGVGLRVSPHPWCRQLLKRLDTAVVSTSANFTGRPAPQSLIELDDRLAGAADLVVDGGLLAGEPSTVLDVTGDKPRVVRAGAVGVEAIEEVIGAVEKAAILE